MILNISVYGLFQPRKYEQSDTKHKQAFSDLLDLVYTATLYLNSFEIDKYFEETD